ncbi:MAG: hypothetical protein ABIK37_01420 [candidate division WOR-3 bacterium]
MLVLVIVSCMIGQMPILTLLVVAWLPLGIAFALLYHLSLYSLDAEYAVPRQTLADILTTIGRAVVLVFLWPVIIVFDTSALRRMWLYWLYLDPKQRETNEELKQALREREFYRQAHGRFVERERQALQRGREMIAGEERKRRTHELHEGDPELESFWLLIGVGKSSDGAQGLVRLYPEHHTVSEVSAQAGREVVLRRPMRCPVCNVPVEPAEVKLPEPVFLRVLEKDSDKLLVEGWALRGGFVLEYPRCQFCRTLPQPVTGELTDIGRATEVLQALRQGLVFLTDLG